jgi:hypothetical protein
MNPAVRPALICFVLLPSLLQAQTGTIAGRVTEAATGEGLLGAAVSIPATGRGALVDSTGRFVIAGVAPGTHRLLARRGGYRDAIQLVSVRAGETTEVAFTLVTAPQLLESVRTEATAPDLELFLTKPALGITSLTNRAVSAVPRLGEPDILRVVQMMPGVAARNDFSTGFNVHGGEADQNLVLIDGYPIYNPFHLGGLFSTFIDATVRDVTLMTGPFPARHGGRLSSVLDVRSAVEGRPGLHGRGEVSLLGLTGTLAAPIANRGSWMLSARRTYADWVASRFTDNTLPYHFRDMQGHVTLSLPAQWRFSVTGYGGDDVLNADLSEVAEDSTEAAGGGTVLFRWGNSVVGATIAKSMPSVMGMDSLVFEQRVSRTRFSTDVDLADGTATLRNTITDVRLGGEVVVHSPAHTLAFGYDASRFRTLIIDGSPQASIGGTNLRQQGTALGVFVDDSWSPSAASRWLLQGGLRLERVEQARWTGVSPRLSVKYLIRPDLALSVATGRTTQWMHSIAVEDSPIRFFDSYIASDTVTPVASAWHAVARVERWMGSARQVRVEAFMKRYARLLESDLSQDPFVSGDEFLPTRGLAYGFDVFARQFETTGGRYSGWIAYSYSVARREQAGFRFAPGHDRRHNLNIVTTMKAGKYVVGSRLGFATGTPYTEIVGQYVRRRFDPITNSWEYPGQPPDDVDYIGATRNGVRYPLAHRLDLSVAREFQRGRTTIRPYLTLVNAYNAKNVFVYILEYGTVPPTRQTISQFPILPSAGVSVAW